MKHKDLHARLRHVREFFFGDDRGAFARFAKATGITATTLARYEERTRPGAGKMAAIVQATGCSAHWLLTGEGHMEGAHVLHGPRPGFPVLAIASAAAKDRVAETEHEYGEPRRVDLPPDAHAIEVRGDSMFPFAADGQHVFVQDRMPEPGELGIVELDDGEPLLKRIYPRPRGRVLLISINPDPTAYPPVELERRDYRRIRRVCGLLI